MGNNNAHYLMYGTTTSATVLQVEFGYSGGVYRLRTGLKNDAGQWTQSERFASGDAAHHLTAI